MYYLGLHLSLNFISAPTHKRHNANTGTKICWSYSLWFRWSVYIMMGGGGGCCMWESVQLHRKGKVDKYVGMFRGSLRRLLRNISWLFSIPSCFFCAFSRIQIERWRSMAASLSACRPPCRWARAASNSAARQRCPTEGSGSLALSKQTWLTWRARRQKSHLSSGRFMN